MKPTELMLGSVLEYLTAEGDTIPSRLDLQGLKWAQEDFVGFKSVHRPIPLTPEIFEKCPLPEGFFIPEFEDGEVYLIHVTEPTEWYGTHVHTLQMFLRSIGLEWQIENLFK